MEGNRRVRAVLHYHFVGVDFDLRFANDALHGTAKWFSDDRDEPVPLGQVVGRRIPCPSTLSWPAVEQHLRVALRGRSFRLIRNSIIFPSGPLRFLATPLAFRSLAGSETASLMRWADQEHYA